MLNRRFSLREILLLLTLFGIVGLAVELVLLRHTDSAAKLIPFGALAVGLISGTQLMLKPTKTVIRFFQTVMVVFVVTGLLGLYFHFKGNIEFAQERFPSLSGMSLAWKALRGATPTLAPGALAQLGLMGLALTYGHPILADGGNDDDPGTA